ncbi:MAG TPA: phosphatidate cytidylyltransferase [Gammaproteobacteria bacterium]|nr:phosphatidate cytidylyltransferase [Gammaproteobacteria bacterium]
MLKQRLITAVILIAGFLGTLFFTSPPVFCVFTEIFALGAAWEWTNLMGMKKPRHKLFYLGLFLIIMQGIFFVPVPISLCVDFFYLTFFFWLATIPLILFYPRGLFWKQSMVCQGIMGMFVLIPSWFAINFIRDVDANGQFLLLFLFILVWSADIAAYFAGRRWGKKPLVPYVSPGKTRVGVYAGIIASLVVTLIPLYMFGVPYHFWPYTLTLSFVTAIFSVIGDLFESLLKRSEGLKDSGNLLPGHGGLLDRMDSLTAAAPIFTLGAIILSRMSS